MKVGDLVNIYDDPTGGFDPFRLRVGIITEMVGYKTTVLVDSALQSWDLSDLKKMAAWKKQDDHVEAARQHESR